MTHKVHPIGYRLGVIRDWKSRWLNTKQYPLHVQEDYRIREYVLKKYQNAGIESIEIERSRGRVLVMIFTSRPGILIGRGGSGIETIRRDVSKILNVIATEARKKGMRIEEGRPEIRIEIQEIRESELYASLVAQNVAGQLERRFPFRRAIKRTLERVVAHKDIQGAKILVKGRLDGAEMARTEFVKEGKLPLQTLRADIDFAHVNARTSYGVVGVKVWLYKGEKLD
ncbi:MAG: 30S ribosomal protein S3 [Candidatus Spechtbacteria bacterium SB0662_bin_43]|uniref:Small ribosomal subunit protein uS3 n=1 Tax=Candidatus Spechtbacteria bacterium SB0662_bin_43 TaxID=2604897 RepID=A0A845DJY6_9BACT|nr:30S ribosomal protein S3 [Candidatus Spechtbacteria bacterium SB0662_bin_43]